MRHHRRNLVGHVLLALWLPALLALTACAGQGTGAGAQLTAPPAADQSGPATVVQEFVTALDAGDQTKLLALAMPDMRSPLDRAAVIIQEWRDAAQPAQPDTGAALHLGPRQQLDVGAPSTQGEVSTAVITARHAAGTLVVTLLMRSTPAGWRVSDWQTERRDLNLPTPGLR